MKKNGLWIKLFLVISRRYVKEGGKANEYMEK